MDDDKLRDMAASACQAALAFGVGEEAFMNLARSVRKAAVAAERDALDRTILELIDLWGTHGNAALIAGDAATSNAWAAAVATVRDVSAAIRAERA